MRSASCERGAVTAELATGMVGVVVVLAGVLSVAQLSLAHVAVSAGAAAGARAAARGDAPGDVTAVATARAGPGSRASASGAAGGPGAPGGRVVVDVVREVRLLLPGAPAVTVTDSATAAVESAGAGAGAGAASDDGVP